MPERRTQKRYKAKERALVAVSGKALPFHIIDISLGGLAFRYMGKEKLTDDITELTIFYGTKIYLENVPAELIADCQLKDGYIPMRRLGIKYQTLTSKQKSQLESFIRDHTTGSL